MVEEVRRAVEVVPDADEITRRVNRIKMSLSRKGATFVQSKCLQKVFPRFRMSNCRRYLYQASRRSSRYPVLFLRTCGTDRLPHR